MESMDCFTDEVKIKLRNYMQLNQYVKKGQILFTGSSLMEQFPISEFCTGLGIEKAVYNRGIGGFTTDDFLKAIHIQLLDLEPSKAFINIGSNDISREADGQAWLFHLLGNYERILQHLKEKLPDTKVYMMAYYPVNEPMQEEKADKETCQPPKLRTNANVRLANENVKKLAKQMGCHYIDANMGLLDDTGELKEDYTLEGIHMYAKAYHQVFENLRPYLL